MKPHRLLIGVAVTLALAACGKQVATHENIRPVRTVVVKPESLALGATYSGEIRARRESALAFRIPGQIVERFVEVGQQVKAGQALLRIDARDVVLQQATARSQLEKARLDYERAKQLRERGFVSQANVDAAKVGFDAAKSQFDLASNQSGYTTLRAERAGVVTAINAEVGQVLAAGTPAVRVAESGEREVVVSVPESRVEELRKAPSLKVTLWASPDKTYAASLRELAPDTDPVTRTYAARISIKQPDEAIRLGMTAYVSLPGQQGEPGFSLPLTAIIDKDGKTRVWVVDAKTERVSPREVKLAGARNDVVLVAAGLKAGDTVVTAGANLLHDQQRVRLAESQLKRQ
ncbi:efflux RND transporter periplasmic adaptor subunit [Chitinimonas sp. BJYL2]|uniref:efflux RND transporter periplasmic adaptor subunit n=1 Tax=Chitinimonas sp. BJYL2 TaxID=2976696 RepID=UPI0022B33D0A|nr:efflux RND transporter periplasmic adaptor subunit [Chitinimonas sp. BJYL2]